MSFVHSTVRLTDTIRIASETLRALGPDQIAASDDPLTVVKNLYASLDAIRDAWPAIATSAHFDDGNEATGAFTDDIARGLKLAADGLWDASNAI